MITILIDTHCHLDHKLYANNIETIIKNAKSCGVKTFLIPGASIDDLPRAVEISQKYDEVFFAVGVHPYDIDNFNLDILNKYVSHSKCVAIGECGLDYYRLPKDDEQKQQIIKKQKEIFIAQIDFAKKINKPLIIHIRDASNDSKKILIDNDASKVGGVLHCFNASSHLLELADFGFYFGIGGVVTFKNAKQLVQILPQIPKHRLILETDSPYLTPHPYRGTTNEPKYVKDIAIKVANILDCSIEEIENLTTKNAKKLFKDLIDE